MEQIHGENLLAEVVNLKLDQRIFVDFPEDVISRMELLGLQVKSSENLFQSYLNNTSEIASELNLTKFLERYTDLAREKDILYKDTVLKCLGTKAYRYITNPKNGMFYTLDEVLKKLVIGKRIAPALNFANAQ